jgi:hypothetical protein
MIPTNRRPMNSVTLRALKKKMKNTYCKGRRSDFAREEVPLWGAAFNPRIDVITS